MNIIERTAQLLSDNALFEAIEETTAHIKTSPTDSNARFLLSDLLTLAGDFEHAKRQISAGATFAPDQAMGFALVSNELRGILAREDWFANGASPSFPEGPSKCDELALELNTLQREGDWDGAGFTLQDLDDARGQTAMIWNDRSVDDIRDLDDRVPHALEIITTGGSYLWIGYAGIQSLELEPISRPRDLAYRRGRLRLKDGSVDSVLIPALYPGSGSDVELCLGRKTDWIDKGAGLSIGVGQRCLLAGDEMVGFHDTTSLRAKGEGRSG